MKGTNKMLQPDCASLSEHIRQLTARIDDIDNDVEDSGNEALSVHNMLRNIGFQQRIDRLLGEQRALRDQWTTLMDQLAICRTTSPTSHSSADLS